MIAWFLVGLVELHASKPKKLSFFEGLMISVVLHEKPPNSPWDATHSQKAGGTFGDVGEKTESMSTGWWWQKAVRFCVWFVPFFFSVAPFPPHQKKRGQCVYVMFFLGSVFKAFNQRIAGLVSRCVSCRHRWKREVDHFPTANEAFQAAWVPEVSREGGCCCHT